jgi:diacylglycerol kinase (ATP)
MADADRTGLRRLIRATAFSVAGLRAAWQNEAAFRQECVLALVLVVELLNSGIEAIVDRVSTERHTLSGRAKDLGSAAVFMSLLLALVIWGFVAYERLA